MPLTFWGIGVKSTSVNSLNRKSAVRRYLVANFQYLATYVATITDIENRGHEGAAPKWPRPAAVPRGAIIWALVIDICELSACPGVSLHSR